MALTKTPICDFGQDAIDFDLLSVDEKRWSLADCKGEKGTLVMFICNHCPYVQAIHACLVQDTHGLLDIGISSVAIMSNDATDYPEDSFANMQKVAKQHKYPFPYLLDDTQAIAKSYGAVCTPDFFGYNADLKLQYRGRLDASGAMSASTDTDRELLEAMRLIANTGKGPADQIPSIGCSIKWKAA